MPKLTRPKRLALTFPRGGRRESVPVTAAGCERSILIFTPGRRHFGPRLVQNVDAVMRKVRTSSCAPPWVGGPGPGVAVGVGVGGGVGVAAETVTVPVMFGCSSQTNA